MADPRSPDASAAEQEEAPLVWSARWSLTTRILAVNVLAVALVFARLDDERSILGEQAFAVADGILDQR